MAITIFGATNNVTVVGTVAVTVSSPVGNGTPAAAVRVVQAEALTYRAAFEFTTPATGDALELRNPDATAVVRIRQLVLQAGAAVGLTLEKRSTLDTGGTSTDADAVPFDSDDAAAELVPRVYTAAPTQGTLVGPMGELNLGANETLFDDYSVRTDKAIVLRENEALAIVVDASVTLRGWVEWTEEG